MPDSLRQNAPHFKETIPLAERLDYVQDYISGLEQRYITLKEKGQWYPSRMLKEFEQKNSPSYSPARAIASLTRRIKHS